MFRRYLIDGQQVTVTRVRGEHVLVYTICVLGEPLAGSVEKTVLGRYRAVDDQDRLLGTFLGLRLSVEHVVREERHWC